MMEAAPSAPFIVPEPNFLLEILIVALDAPAQFGQINQPAAADLFRQGREPVFGRRLLPLRPFDQQPLLCAVLGQPVTMSDPNTHAGKAREQPIGRPFPPFDLAPGSLRQSKRELCGRDQVWLVASALLGWRSVAPFRFGT